jgi:Tfp pilus assembly protein PilW
MRSQRGLTLVELMLSTVAIGAAVLVATGLVASIRSTEKFSRDYSGDLAGLRRAVRVIESDLRVAADISDLDVRHDGDRLVRDGRTLARNVGEFRVTRLKDLALVRIRLGSRSSAPGRRGAVAFSVRMRNAGGPR